MQVGPLLFFGEHEHRVDSQGRVSLPARFREAFRSGIVLARGYDQCIVAYPPSQWEAFASEVANLPMNRARNRRMRRMNFSSAYHLEADRQGRAQLPLNLRQYAQIDQEVVIAGMGDFVEIWDRELWSQERAEMEEEAWQIAETTEEHP